MKVALVHDWLTGMRGGERCLEVFCELFPDADIFTLLYVKGAVSSTIEQQKFAQEFGEMLSEHGEFTASSGLNGLVAYAKLVSNQRLEQ